MVIIPYSGAGLLPVGYGKKADSTCWTGRIVVAGSSAAGSLLTS
jgi:hypothetical protein